MGISTLQSYRGAQIFEAIGLNRDLVDRYFTGTASRMSGIGLDVIAEEVRRRHARRLPRPGRSAAPTSTGAASTSGAATASTTCSTRTRSSKLQHATRAGQPHDLPGVHASWSTTRASALATLRGLFELQPAGAPVPLDEVEPVETIVKRFATGAMSYGSISQEAHETLAIAMNRIGGKSNTGEGGEDPARYRARSPTATGGGARSSRSPPAASASPASTSSTPTSCRSRWPRAPSPARAASSPATRSTRGSPRSASRRRASG